MGGKKTRGGREGAREGRRRQKSQLRSALEPHTVITWSTKPNVRALGGL